jgi:phage gp29-like protein
MAGTALVPYQPPKAQPLVDSRGRPLRKDVLTQEIAGPSVTGVRSILSGHPAHGLTPQRLAGILRRAEHGDAIAYLELAEEMEEKDLHYHSVLGTRKRAISQLPIEVDPATESAEDEADAQIIRDWLQRDTLQAELFDILDGVGKGYSATEIIWEFGELWLPGRLERQDPRFFEFDRTDGRTLYLRGESGQQLPLEQFKFITHVHPAKSGLAIRGGLARVVAWAYLFKNYSLKDWVAFLEVYGLPLRIGKYDNGETEDNIKLLERAVGQIGADAGAVIPKSMVIEFVKSEGAASAELFEKLCTYLDQQISKAVLGQTNTTDAQAGGLGSGQAQVHNDVRGDIEKSDAVQLAATLNRDLVRPIIILNRGTRKAYPRIRIGRPDPIDVKQAIDSMKAGVELGVPVAVSTFRKLTGLPEPKDGEELLQAPKKEPPARAGEQPGGKLPAKTAADRLLGALKRPDGAKEVQGSAAILPAPPDPDAIDRAIEEELGDWESLVEPGLAPIEEVLAEARSLEDVKQVLADRAGQLIDRMDVSAVAELLARAGFGAAIAGRLDEPGR